VASAATSQRINSSIKRAHFRFGSTFVSECLGALHAGIPGAEKDR
jgi:hypothetical protein